ncbi:Predicted lipid-binding transport protein, Tim44 family [Enhydrobacter aerosaccus]|uniref:Predicted lipid-binding transport protein, Tim44 family n=1 Tax=Enhydrobacter aerosaccus TaxID=225324 RepID=A0A1T4NEY0_9HYPH|nr:Tim44 domain-containing protein [Enhydrobacter aerosaccus]SJZ77685.1 Predicted lipid-binding transport protein, Tim44 family [Enhydrobacter aerosaccus]
MKTFRWLAVLAALLLVIPTLAPSSADARAGGGTNSGSRGTRTTQPPAPTQTAPSAAPIQRTVTPTQPATTPAATTAQAAPQAGGFMSRHPFLSGLMGGLFGAGLFGMLFGGGFGGGAGIFGLFFQMLLIGGLGYLAVRLFRGGTATAGRPAYAYATASPSVTDVPIARSSVPQTGGSPLLAGGAALGAGTGQLAIAAEDYNDFERLLGAVQTAYSAGDLARLRGLATPEMVGYFSEQLSANASRGVENKIDGVKLEQGDLAEAWREGGIDYATVGMRFSLIDVTRRIADGAIVEGNAQARTEATEVWTFLRSRGGKWIVSAIQQAQRQPAMVGAAS